MKNVYREKEQLAHEPYYGGRAGPKSDIMSYK